MAGHGQRRDGGAGGGACSDLLGRVLARAAFCLLMLTAAYAVSTWLALKFDVHPGTVETLSHVTLTAALLFLAVLAAAILRIGWHASPFSVNSKHPGNSKTADRSYGPGNSKTMPSKPRGAQARPRTRHVSFPR